MLLSQKFHFVNFFISFMSNEHAAENNREESERNLLKISIILINTNFQSLILVPPSPFKFMTTWNPHDTHF